MSNLKEFYKVDALQHEIAFLKKELKDLGQTHIGMHKNLETLQKKLTTAEEVVLNSATDMSKLHEEVKELRKEERYHDLLQRMYRAPSTIDNAKLETDNNELRKQLSAIKVINGTLKEKLELSYSSEIAKQDVYITEMNQKHRVIVEARDKEIEELKKNPKQAYDSMKNREFLAKEENQI